MSNFPDDLPIEAQTLARKAKIKTAEQAILTPTAHLLLESSPYDIFVLKTSAAKTIAKQDVKVSDLFNLPYCMKWSRLSFGCAALDKCTLGGVVSRGITEFCGTSGVGKTQVVLQLSLMAQLPKEFGGFNAGVAFICTEDLFPSKRLFEMSKAFEKKYPSLDIKYLANIHVEHVLESEDLLKCVTERLTKLMSSVSIGLIIIDSVAAIFRTYSNYIERARDMRKLANALLLLADKYNCVVICINQTCFNAGVAFICTEDLFPSKRLFEMSKAFEKKYPSLDIKYLANIHVEHVLESEDLLKCVTERLTKLMSSVSIGLIIIDSVAAIFRTYSNYIERARDMRKLANALLLLADKYNCVVICINQVATVNDKEPDVPCLGLSWAHLGRTRIRISRVPKQVKYDEMLITVRKLEVMYCPETPVEYAEFLITKDGVIDVPQS